MSAKDKKLFFVSKKNEDSFCVLLLLFTLSLNESHLSAYSNTVSGPKRIPQLVISHLYNCQDTGHLWIPLLKRREITSAPELRRKEGSFLSASQTFKTDAIRFTAGWRPGPDTLSTGFCPPAASLEKTSSGG